MSEFTQPLSFPVPGLVAIWSPGQAAFGIYVYHDDILFLFEVKTHVTTASSSYAPPQKREHPLYRVADAMAISCKSIELHQHAPDAPSLARLARPFMTNQLFADVDHRDAYFSPQRAFMIPSPYFLRVRTQDPWPDDQLPYAQIPVMALCLGSEHYVGPLLSPRGPWPRDDPGIQLWKSVRLPLVRETLFFPKGLVSDMTTALTAQQKRLTFSIYPPFQEIGADDPIPDPVYMGPQRRRKFPVLTVADEFIFFKKRILVGSDVFEHFNRPLVMAPLPLELPGLVVPLFPPPRPVAKRRRILQPAPHDEDEKKEKEGESDAPPAKRPAIFPLNAILCCALMQNRECIVNQTPLSEGETFYVNRCGHVLMQSEEFASPPQDHTCPARCDSPGPWVTMKKPPSQELMSVFSLPPKNQIISSASSS